VINQFFTISDTIVRANLKQQLSKNRSIATPKQWGIQFLLELKKQNHVE